MSKCVLLSVRPQYCELIANGKKTIEVRKTRPKLETPFKCYIYCTQGSNHLCLMQNSDGVNLIACCNWKTALPFGGSISNGKVIGEFVCDHITNLFTNSRFWLDEKAVEQTCLTGEQIREYANGKDAYGWHISDLQIYDKPRELSEFHKPTMSTGLRYEDDAIKRPPESWRYVEEYDGKR